MRNGYGFLTKNNGDNFEGYWINNKREGVGSYFFNNTKKLIVGEWVDDSPKSAIYCELNDSQENILKLPSLQMEDLNSLLETLF